MGPSQQPPGHPALREICDFIAKHATAKFLVEGNLDTLERTGPGIWTDIVLKHALLHPAIPGECRLRLSGTLRRCRISSPAEDVHQRVRTVLSHELAALRDLLQHARRMQTPAAGQQHLWLTSGQRCRRQARSRCA